MKTFSTIPHDLIRNHQTNNSKAKLAYKFSQSKRFKDPNPQCPTNFYQQSMKTHLSNRKSSFGYGKKYDFTKTLTCSPSVTQYNIKSSIDKQLTRGRSFGCSRQSSLDRSYIAPSLQKVPGPGNYNQKLRLSSPSYSIRERTIDVITKKLSFFNNPGPNHYNHYANTILPQNGKQILSKFSNIPLGTIKSQTLRFDKIKESPGPPNYQYRDQLNSKGKYILSKFKGNGTRVFGQTARKELWDTLKDNPGPGNYQENSEFGRYGDAKFYKTMSTFKR